MSWKQETLEQIRHLRVVKQDLKDQFVGRDGVVDLLVLAVITRENLLLLGPPGTAKSELIIRFTQLIEATRFHYLLTRFTEPSELFGPMDLAAFQDGSYRLRTNGMLPEAEVAFLDEIFQGSSAILNTLLTLIHERVFINGGESHKVPLITLVGASNTIPDDPALHAFSDRFLLRKQVEPVSDDEVENLIEMGWHLETDRIKGDRKAGVARLNVKDLLELHGRLSEVDMKSIKPVYSELVRHLRAEGVEFTDRRSIKALKLVAASALLRESTRAEPEDFRPLIHIWSRPEEASIFEAVVTPFIHDKVNTSDGRRDLDQVLRDLEILKNRRPAVSQRIPRGRHLISLGDLRREVLRHHADHPDALSQIEAEIQLLLREMEAQHV